MIRPTAEQIDAAFAEHATHTMGDSERHWFSNPTWTHTTEKARAIVEVCLTLERPVSDVITIEMMLTLVRELLSTHERLAALEAVHPAGRHRGPIALELPQ